jgi:hypothetical protein
MPATQPEKAPRYSSLHELGVSDDDRPGALDKTSI